MTTSQLIFTEAELLTTSSVAEPLFAGGVRCHGGFVADGSYVSPRTQFRTPAISAWQENHREVFGTEILDVSLDTWPAHVPNLAQARFLLAAGVPEPLIATLTRIGTVEGFGANIRNFRPSNMQRYFEEDVRGTALDHLASGLFEAHGRDEAGWEEEAGHKDMWFAARDVAFETPRLSLEMEGMLTRMGFGAASKLAPARLLPEEIDPALETMISVMIRVLFIEISAFHTFQWSESWLSDKQLVAGDGEAARLVSYIRADETPHIQYLATALTEMRDRTWITGSGKKFKGTDMLKMMWDPMLANSIGARHAQSQRAALDEVTFWCAERKNGADLIAEYTSLSDESASQ